MLLSISFFLVLRGAQVWLSSSPPASCLVQRRLHSTSHDAVMAEKRSPDLAAYLRAVDSMHRRGVSIPKGVVCELVKECLKTRRSISICKEIHRRASRSNLSSDSTVGSLLIRLFAVNGSLSEANSIFRKIHEPDDLAWSTIIFSNAKLGDSDCAMDLYLQMQERNVRPSASTFAAILKTCCGMKSLDCGRKIHLQIIEYAQETVLGVINMLITMYCKCGCLSDASALGETAEIADVVTWSSLIAGYAQDGLGDEAIHLFHRMQQEGIYPNNITFVSVLQACSCTGTLSLGQMIHVLLSMQARDVYIDSALVDMYMKCGRAENAQRVFEGALERNLITWSAMISGYVHLGREEEALLLYRRMQQEGTEPNDLMYKSLLTACSRMKVAEDGSKGNVDELWRGVLKSDAASRNALIDLYAKEGSLASAHLVFELLPQKDREAWNTLIVAYAQHDQGEEAMKLFQRMPYAVVDMDNGFYLAVVKACTTIGALGTGMLIHGIVAEMELEVGSCLVDMYAKCGRLEDASITFQSLQNRDVVAWGAIITGHAQCGGFASALQYFHEMQAEGFMPNEVIFVSLLSACSHLGLGAQGYNLFRSMKEKYGIIPTVEHYNCLVDLLARAGHLDEAKDMLISIPYRSNIIGFTSLLEHSKSYGNLELFNDSIDHVCHC